MPTKPRHPDGWARRAIGDVAAVSFSSVDKKSVAGEVPVRLCNYMDVWKNHYIDADLAFMQATATPREIKQFTLVKHDVLLTKDSETKEDIADPAVVRTDRDDLVLGYHLALVRPDPKKAHGPFIAAQLALPQFRAQFVRVANGATRYGLGIDEVRNGTLLLPGVEEQKTIAEYLGAVDAAIDATRGVIEQTRRLKTAVLQDLLTRDLPGRHSEFREVKGLGQVPRAWKCMPLSKAVSYWQYGLSESLSDSGAYPCFRMNNYRNGRMVASDLKYINLSDKALGTYLLERGDILFNRTNSRDLVGKIGIFDLDGDYVFASYLVRLRANPSIARPEFLNLLLNTAVNQERIRRLATPGVSQSNINVESLKQFRVALPSTDEQDTMIEFIAGLDARRDREIETQRQLVDLKTALSQALLTGRVRVPAGKTTTNNAAVAAGASHG